MFTVRAPHDNRTYPVVESYENTTEAANMLARINEMNQSVIKHMVVKYAGTNYASHANRMAKKYNPDAIGEHLPIGTKNTSYVMGKGKKVRFCLRPDTNRELIHNFPILSFVSLHEISHIMNKTNGHGNDFWSTFKFVLQNAAEIGAYTPVNYSTSPVRYCNLEIDYNPLYDTSVKMMSP